jgi:hypothetical protein
LPSQAAKSLDMKNETGRFGIVVGGIVALVAIFFIFSGGSLGGKTTIEGDQDLPPIANPAQ